MTGWQQCAKIPTPSSRGVKRRRDPESFFGQTLMGCFAGARNDGSGPRMDGVMPG
jgi:hypothetical protein